MEMNGPVLRAEIGAGQEGRMDAVAQQGNQLLDVRQGDLALPLENLQHVVLPHGGRDVPLLHVADALGVFHPRRRHQGDVAEGRAGHGDRDAVVALLLKLGDPPLVPGQVVVAEAAEFLGVIGRIEVALRRSAPGG